MAMDRDDVLRKVRALLAQAEDPGVTAEEAKSFSAAAQRLIAKYAIEEALLRGDTNANRGEPDITQVKIKPGNLAEGSCELLWALCRLNRCRGIRDGYSNPGYVTMKIIGFESDREIVQLLHQSLGMQALTEMVGSGIKNTKSHAYSFFAGYTQVISERFTAAMRSAEEEVKSETGASSESMALALVSDKKKVDLWVQMHFPDLGHHSVRIGINSGAYGSGRDAGRRADLGQSKVSGGGGRELGR